MNKEVTLCEILEITSSKRIHAEDYVKNGVPFYRSKEIIQLSKNQKITETLYISNEQYSAIKLKFPVVEEGDILLTSVGTIGIPYYVSNPNFYFKDGNLTWFRNFSDCIDSKFLLFWMQSKFFLNQIENNNIGAVQKALTIDFLKNFKITLPSIETQKNIVSVLSSLDSKIELNNKINTELEAMAKTLYDYWFVQFDFPDKDGKPYKTSGGKMVWNEELKREIPDGWEVSSLKDIVELVKGNVNPSDIKPNTPYIGLEHIGRKTIVLSDWANSEQANSDKTAFKKHDILFGKIRPYFHKVAVATFDGITSTDTIILRPKKKIYFGLALQTVFADKFVEIATQSSTGSKMPRADWNVLQDYKFPIPKSDLLKPFQNIFERALNKIEISVIENKTLSELRDWLLPMLMNGQVKVN